MSPPPTELRHERRGCGSAHAAAASGNARQPLSRTCGGEALLGAALLLSGCLVGPNYHPPQTELPDQFRSPTTQPASAPAVEACGPNLARWWASLQDPVLDELIQQAMESNLDLAIVAQRITEARLQRGIVSAGLWPLVTFASGGPGRPSLYSHVSGSLERAHWLSRERASLQGRQDIGLNGITTPPSLYAGSPGRHPTYFLINPGTGTVNVRPPLIAPKPSRRVVGQDEITFDAGLEAIWELDVFGGIRRAIEASEADVQAAIEARNDLLVILAADVARTYVELRGFQNRVEIAERNIAIQRRTVQLVLTRLRNGLTSELDVALAERQLATTESRVPMLQAAVTDAQSRLAVLMGMLPEDVPEELLEPAPMPAPPPALPCGLPSELLRRRPDIRRAERELAAFTARIGVATAQLFPRFVLTGGFGLQTSDIRHFLDANSLIWSVGPGIRWPIFDAGVLIGEVHIAEARAEQALLNYRRVLLLALEEVEIAMAGYAGQRERFTRLTEAVDASARAAHLARSRYDKGLTDFLNVLDAERALYDLEDQAAVSEQELFGQLIDTYKALGRGWEVEGPESVCTRPGA